MAEILPQCVAKIGMQTKKRGRCYICETLLFPFALGFVPAFGESPVQKGRISPCRQRRWNDTAEVFRDSRKFNLELFKNKNIQEANVWIENKRISEE